MDKNIANISVRERVFNLSDSDVLELYSYIEAFNVLEIRGKGNIYERTELVITYDDDLKVVEYINIYNVITTSYMYDFFKYFLNARDRFSAQAIDTKINLSDYLSTDAEVRQHIRLQMVFDVEAGEDKLEQFANELRSIALQTSAHTKIARAIRTGRY